MSKIEKLRYEAIMEDKSSFIDSIFDFSEEEIIEFTEQDFKEILQCCAKIKLEGVYEFLDYLFKAGTQALDNSRTKRFKENTLIGRFYLSVLLSLHSEHDIDFAAIAMNLGVAYLCLGELGIDPEKNLKESIRLQLEARKIYSKNCKDYAHATANLGSAYLRLAEFGVNPKINIEKSIKLQDKAKEIYPKDGMDYARSNMTIGFAYLKFADFGVNPKTNLEKSIKLQEESRKIFPRGSMDYASATMNMGFACLGLAELGVNPKINLEESIKLQDEARKIFPKDSMDYAGTIMNKGIALENLANFGINPKINLEESIKLQEEARKIFPKNSSYYARSTMNMGNAKEGLAGLGINPKINLEESIKLQEEARKIFPKNSMDYARSTLNMGVSHLKLAELEVNPKNNLEESIKLQDEARKIFPKDSMDYARSTVTMGSAYLRFSYFGVNPKINLEESIKLQEEARRTFPKDSIGYAEAITSMGAALVWLAGLGVNPKNNLEEAIKLQEEARKIFPKDSSHYARTTLNMGNAYLFLGRFGIEPESNFKIAQELYEISKNIFYEIKDGWGYPAAILNNYILNRDFFWKNGNKSILQKASDSLKESKKNIESWEILRKNEILGTLSEVEADLCELDEDFFNAGMKYCDAYRLTKDLYYSFMYEFCEAKSSRKEKPFCQLAEKWKECDKEEIFLDIYDYTVFECCLEEAIENEALRFDEISKATIKLNEILSRTQIQHIKVRVGACLDILYAYLNYFPEKDQQRDEEKTKKNISNACKIFKSQGYIHEIHLCNLFVEAIKNKDKQEGWLNLIKNQLSDNLSKLIGEAAINEITKSQTIGMKADFGEIKTGIKEMKINIDDLIFSSKPGITEELVITVGAEFYGTGAQHVITIPLQDIYYHDLKRDLETIKGKSFLKLTSLPKLANKVKDYLIRKKKMMF